MIEGLKKDNMRYDVLRKILLLLGDIFLLFLSLYLTLILRWKSIPTFGLYLEFAKSFFWLFLFWLFLLFIFDFYSLNLKTGSFFFFRYCLIFAFLILFSGILYFYLQPKLPIAPKTIFILNILIFCILFFLLRLFFEWLFKKTQRKEKIIFLDSPPELHELLSYLKNPLFPYKVVETPEPKDLAKVISKEKIQKTVLSSRAQTFEDNIFSFPDLEVESFSKFYEEITGKVALSSLKDADTLREFYKKEEKSYGISKRIFDIFFSLTGVLILAVLYPFVAVAIKIDSKGPAFFIQKRVGKNRKIFKFYKFRTMEISKDEKGEWRTKRKGTITSVGKILRFTHIDELPQFLNILKGEMSFIGPRPEWKKLAKIFEKEIPFYFLRYQVKPGFTGWAQINFPPSFAVGDTKEKFQYDLYYIKHRSFLFDIIIFLKSLRKVFG